MGHICAGDVMRMSGPSGIVRYVPAPLLFCCTLRSDRRPPLTLDPAFPPSPLRQRSHLLKLLTDSEPLISSLFRAFPSMQPRTGVEFLLSGSLI